MNRSFFHKTIFWLVVLIFLSIIFGFYARNYQFTFYFVSFMLPIAVATSYVFNNFLVDRYLQKGRYLKFTLYLIYTFIISLWLEMIMVLIAFVFLANYHYTSLPFPTNNILLLGFVLYVIVFADGFRCTYIKFKKQQLRLDQLQQQNQESSINITVDRKRVKINYSDLLYIESLGDYVKIHTAEKVFITREKISKLANRLPVNFLRIHRSFLVNSSKIEHFTRESIKIHGQELPVSRSYKVKAIEFLEKAKS